MEISLKQIINKLVLILPFIGFFNFELIDGIGVIDLYLDLLILLIISSFKISFTKQEILIAIVLIILSVTGALLWHIVHPKVPINIVTIGFFYKNFKFIELIILTKFLSKSINIKIDIWITFVLILFISWTIFYSFFLQGIISSFLSPRIAFPFTDYEKTNAHLFSYCFGFVLACYALFTKHNNTWKVLLIITSIIALQFTGSRNYIISLLVPTIYLFGKKFLKHSLSIIFSLIIFFSILIYLFDLEINQYLVENNLSYIFDRVYSLDFENDSSSSGRIRKLLIGLEYFIEGFILLGLPIGATAIVWFDGIIPSILVQFGLFGLIIVLTFIYTQYRKENSRSLKFLILYMVIGNLITEFIYVTRGIVFSIFIYLVIKSVITQFDNFNNETDFIR